MLKNTFIISLSALILLGCSKSVKQNNNKSEANSTIITIRGSDKIKDEILRKTMLEYFTFESKYDFLKEYNYLSSRILKNNFKGINSAEEYVARMKKTTEEYVKTEYLEVTDFKKVNDNNCIIYVSCRSQDSGVTNEMSKEIVRYGYIFVKEYGLWKYDGTEPGSFEVLE